MEVEPLFTPDTHIAEAGRAILAAELETMREHESALQHDADVTAVHETRKAIRRSFTAIKLFDPYFEPGVLKAHRRRLRKIMRRLGSCRDAAVFLIKLAEFGESDGPLTELEAYWQEQKSVADEALCLYLNKPKRRAFFEEYTRFTGTQGLGVLPLPEPLAPVKVRHLASLLIYSRLATVRAFNDHLADAPAERLHRLRIEFKELRYTLRFFAPLMGPEIQEARVSLKEFQDLLGNVNDATVALNMLADMSEHVASVTIYRDAKKAEIKRLIGEFPQLWEQFNSPKWRRKLAAAIAVL